MNTIKGNSKIFDGTKAEKMANVILTENVKPIKSIIIKEPTLKNFKENKYGTSLAHWAVRNKKCKSLEALLESGVRYDLVDKFGETPLFETVFNYSNKENKLDSCFRALLKFGADPNFTKKELEGFSSSGLVESGTSVLMLAASRNIKITKKLVEYGASINYTTNSNRSAAIVALLDKNIEVAHFLIVENNAEIIEPYNAQFILSNSDSLTSGSEGGLNNLLSRNLYPVDILSNWVFPLGSESHQKKLEIIEEFERQGVSYWSREIPERIISQIKKLYPESWENYIIRY